MRVRSRTESVPDRASPGSKPATSSARPHLTRTGDVLTIGTFRLARNDQVYVLPAEIRVDLNDLRPGRYRVLAVHNFHVEDDNPNLDVCVAGIYFAARCADGRWEEPERFPVECRTLAVLGEVHVP